MKMENEILDEIKNLGNVVIWLVKEKGFKEVINNHNSDIENFGLAVADLLVKNGYIDKEYRVLNVPKSEELKDIVDCLLKVREEYNGDSEICFDFDYGVFGDGLIVLLLNKE